jgi:transposase
VEEKVKLLRDPVVERAMSEATPRETELSEQLDRVLVAMEELRVENALLRQKLEAVIKRLFGARSEQLDPAQLLLLLQGFDEGPKVAEPVAAEEPRRSTVPSPPRERRPRLPEHLPVVEEIIEPEPVQACPGAWRRIGEEVTEQLDYEPARFLRRRIVRPTYVRRDHPFAAPITAPLHTLQDRCLAAPGLLAQVITAKYCDHLPLYRQEGIYASRHGVELSRQTMAQWMGLCADWLRPIYESIRTGVLGGGYVQVDETPIRYLEPGHGKTKLGDLWVACRPGVGVVFEWHTSRAGECLRTLIPAHFHGIMQSDGYAAYPAFVSGHNASGGATITLAGCWAHARRKFYEAAENGGRGTAWLLRQIQHLYRIEAWLRERHAGPVLRAAVRAAQSRPIVERIGKAMRLLQASGRHLPQSNMGKALRYAIEQWSGLQVFLGHGQMEIDNNLVENAIRPTAIGKKNWLFIGEAAAGERGAILYTIVENCRRLGVDPYAYLRDILTLLPRATNWQIPDLTPQAWAKARKSTTKLQSAA